MGRKGAASASKDTKWQLKPNVWLEVRPYQYPDYTDNVRTTVARSARTWLSSLKIPESDPAWDHVKFRSNGSSTASSANAQVRAINGTTSAAVKKTKAKPKDIKPTGIDVFKAKSEAIRPSPQSTPTITKASAPTLSSANTSMNGWNGKSMAMDLDPDREEGEISQSNTPPRGVNTPPIAASPIPSQSRKPPGSRQMLAPPSASSQLARQASPQPTRSPSHPSTSSAAAASAPYKRSGPVDARGPKRPAPEQSERARAAPPIPPPAPIEKKPVVVVTTERVRVKNKEPAVKKERERESDRESLRPPSVRDRGRDSDVESVRALKRSKDRESDLEDMIEKHKERELQREKKKREEARKAREQELREEEATAALEAERAQRKQQRMREKEAAERAAEKAERLERIERAERLERKRAKEIAAASATASSSKKRKQPEFTDSDYSSDSSWGIEDRKPKKSQVSSSSAKVKREREDALPPPTKTATSSYKLKRESSPPLKRVKRELSPIPPPSKKASNKSSNISVSSSRETSQIVKTKVKDRDYDKDWARDRDHERTRDREKERDRDREKVRVKDRERERERDREYRDSRPSNGSNGVSKKRYAPDYTSSSEEEEDEKPLTKVANKISRKAVAQTPQNSQTPPVATPRSRTLKAARPAPSPPPLPSDHDSLRSRYSITYMAYIDVFQKLCSQKAKISAMLSRRSGSVSAESDADIDMLTPEELEVLKSRHSQLHDELEKMARIHAQ